MIGLGDPLFWGLVAALTCVNRYLGLPARWRPAVFALATLFLFHQRPGWPILACLVAVAGYAWVALATARWRGAVLGHTLVMAGIFVASQQVAAAFPDIPVLVRIMPLVGLPYVFLRFTHLLVEIAEGRLERPGFVDLFAYLLPFHQILAGPIQRFPSFAQQVQAPLGPLDADTALLALNRITNGFVKKAILAELLREGVGFEYSGATWWTWVEMDLFALYLYLDFSGYMDIIIGAGTLVGWRTPENFDWPFSSRNIIEFWTRWHISLSELVRDYVFNPLNLTLQRGLLRGRPVLTGMVCYMASMVLVGLWHRFDVQFAIYGVLHGTGIVACKLWEVGLKRQLGKKGFKAYRESRPIGWIATVLNYHFVAATLLFAFHPPARALDILASLVGL